MSLKFNCNNCRQEIIVDYIKAGEITKCWNCGNKIIVPTYAQMTNEKPIYKQSKLVTEKIGESSLEKKLGYEEIVLVTWSRRLANFIIDLILCQIAYIFLLVIFVNMDEYSVTGTHGFSANIIWILLVFFYYFLFETAFQRTPAKFLTGTKVVMIDGSKPTAGTITKRTLSRFVPFEVLSGSNGTWWHDRWTLTRVVKISSIGEIHTQKKQELDSKLEYVCSECGIDVTEDTIVCPKCGADLSIIENNGT